MVVEPSGTTMVAAHDVAAAQRVVGLVLGHGHEVDLGLDAVDHLVHVEALAADAHLG